MVRAVLQPLDDLMRLYSRARRWYPTGIHDAFALGAIRLRVCKGWRAL